MHFGLPGPFELIIVLIIGLLCVGVPIALVVAILAAARKSGRSIPDSPPCPNCGSHVVPNARFCHQCGSPLGPA